MVEPTLEGLCNLVTPNYATHWKAIGQKLGLRNELLDTIEHDHHHRAEDCCNALWKHWLDMGNNTIWKKVIEAIEIPKVVKAVTNKIQSEGRSVSGHFDAIPLVINTVSGQLQKYFIQERYKVSEDDWPSYQPEHFTSVALIHHREKHVTTKEVIAVANVMHKGEIDVSASKASRKVSDIFSPYISGDNDTETIKTTVVLIEGAPGIGKTILSKEIAFQWAKKGILNDKHFVFLMFLRDPCVQQINSLEQFVCCAINASNKNSTVEAVMEYLEYTAGECCTIIFDGYDEISEEVRTKSFIAKILSRKILKLCGLVITSRPIASVSLHDIADCRVEILGFTKEDRKEYIYRSLKNDDISIRAIEGYLETNPFIDSLCYIPLNMTILICLFKESKTNLPKTQTEINKQFACVTISRYLRREKHISMKSSSLQDLPSPYGQQLRVLSKLAFIFLGKEKIVFNDDDIKANYPKCLEKLSTLGLLKVVQYYNIFECSSSLSYNFLHFSMQEFLAAFYIASSSKTKQLKILQEVFWHPKYLSAGIMYVGLARFDLLVFKHFLSGSKYFITSKLFGTKGIAQSTFTDKVKSLHLFQCFLETGNDHLLQQVGNNLSNNKIDLSGHALLVKDIHTFSFFLTRSPTKIWKEINLSRCYIRDFGLNIFSQGFLDSSENNIKVENLIMSYNLLTSSTVNKVFDLVHCFTVERLLISDNNIDYQVFDDAAFTMCLNHEIMKLHVEKVSNYKSSFYFINSKFDKREDMRFLCNTKGDCSLYFWKANVLVDNLPALMSAIFADFSFVSVFESDLQDEVVVEISSKLLDMFAKETATDLEYVLQSKSKLSAYKSNLHKVLPACKLFVAQLYESNLKFKPTNDRSWNSIELHECIIDNDDFNILANCLIDKDLILYLDKLDISKCRLTNSSVDTILHILEFCIIKQIILSNNDIQNDLLCDSILNQASVQSGILNFRNRVPLVILNNFDDKQASLLLSNIFLINCDVDEAIAANSYFEKLDLPQNIFLFNINSDNILNYISQLCKQQSISINFYQANLSDEIGVEIATVLIQEAKIHTFVLVTTTKLLACRVKQMQITAVLQLCSVAHFDTLQLKNCKIEGSEVCKLFSINTLKIWNAIELSECNIKDDELRIFCNFFSQGDSEVYIKLLNLSYNCFTLEPIAELLQYCTIEKLDIAPTSMSGSNFNELLLNYSIESRVLNFESKVPLVVHTIIEDKEKQETNLDYLIVFLPCYHHFTDISLEFTTSFEEQLCNVYFVEHEPTKTAMILSIMHITSKSIVKIISFKESIVSDALASIIYVLNKQKGCNTYIKILDVSECGIQDEGCKQLCKSLFNEKSALKHVKELDFTNNLLTLPSVEIFSEVLQFCIVEKLLISSSTIYKKLNNIIVAEYFNQRQILNYHSGIPLVVIHTKKSLTSSENRVENCKKLATVLLMNSRINVQFYQIMYTLTMDNYFLGEVVLCNCLHINDLREILSISYKNCLPNISIFENSMDDAKLNFVSQHLSTPQEVRYGLVSSKQLLMYRGVASYILKALELSYTSNTLTVIRFINCDISEENLIDIGNDLSVKFSALANIAFSNCSISDNASSMLCKVLFSEVSKISHIQTLDMSHNNLTVSAFVIMVKSLQYCIIEKLIISDNNILNDEIGDIILTEYCNGITICNFHQGIPVIVINNVQHHGIASENISTIFWKIDEFDEATINHLYKSLGNDNILKRYFFALNGVSNACNRFSMLEKFLPNSAEIIFIRTDLTDEELIHMSAINQAQNFKYVLVSMQYLHSNLSANKLIASLLENNLLFKNLQITNCCIRLTDLNNVFLKYNSRKWNTIDFSGCNIGDMGCATLCKWFSHNESNEGYIKILNLSDNQLTSASIISITELLKVCLIEEIIVHKNSFLGDQFTNQLCTDFVADKKFLNFIRNVPLVVNGALLSVFNLKHKVYSSKLDKTTLGMCNIYATQHAISERTIQPLLDVNMEVFNIYFVFNDREKLKNVLSVIYTNSMIRLGVIQDSFILNKEATGIITNLTKSKLSDNSDPIRLIDISACLNECQICTTAFKMFFNNEIQRHHIKELDCSQNILTSSCFDAVLESLQYCTFSNFKLSSSASVFNVFTRRVLEQYEQRVQILNFVNGIPLTITNKCTSQHSGKEFSCGFPHSVSFLVQCKINDKTRQIICKPPANRILVINCFLLNDLLDMMFLCNNLFYQIVIHEIGHCDEASIEFIRNLSTSQLHTQLEYILANEKQLIAYRANQHKIMDTLKCFPSILTFEMVNCFVPDYHLLHYISTECKFIQNVTLSHCDMDDTYFAVVTGALFLGKPAITYLKMLDVSYNKLTSNTIVKCLQYCVIEQLFISFNCIERFSDCLLASYCYGGSKIKNFLLRIPLVVMRNSNKEGEECRMIFVDGIKNIHDTLTYFSACYTCDLEFYFLKSFIMVTDVDDVISFNHILPKNAKVFVLESNLTEQTALKVVGFLTKMQLQCNLGYLLTSTNKMHADMVNEQLINAAIKYSSSVSYLQLHSSSIDVTQLKVLIERNLGWWDTFDLSGCSLQDGDCSLLSGYFSSSNDNYVNVLNLSYNQLTSNSVMHIINILKKCIIRRLIFLNNLMSDDNFKEAVYHSQQSIANFKRGISLSVERSVVGYMKSIYNIYLVRSVHDSQILHQCFSDENGELYEIFVVNYHDKRIKSIVTMLLYAKKLKVRINLITEITEYLKILEMSLKSFYSIRLHKTLTVLDELDVSTCKIDQTVCQTLCKTFFNESSSIRALQVLRVSFNHYSCLNIIIQSLQFCTIQYVAISSDVIAEKSLCDLILNDYYCGIKMLNFESGVPLMFMVYNTTSFNEVEKYATAFLQTPEYKKFLSTLLCDPFFHFAPKVTVYLLQCSSLTDNLVDTRSVFQSLVTNKKVKVVFYETGLMDKRAEALSECFTKQSSNIAIRFILTSETKLLANSSSNLLFSEILQREPSIDYVQITGCDIDLFRLKDVFIVGLRNWDTINLSSCCIRDKQFVMFTKYFAINANIIHINTLNLSANNLTSASFAAIADLLENCTVKHLILSNNNRIKDRFSDMLYNQHHVRKSICNFKHGIVLIINQSIMFKSGLTNSYNIYISSHALDLQDVKYCLSDDRGQYYEFFLVTKNDKLYNIAAILYKGSIFKVINYIDDAETETLLEMIFTLFCKHKVLKPVSLDLFSCNLGIKMCYKLFKLIFNHTAIFDHIKELNVSSSQFTMSHLDAISVALEHCVIEKLIIPSDDIHDDTIGDRILTHYNGPGVLNFTLGIPLVVMNDVNISVNSGRRSAVIFIKQQPTSLLSNLNLSTLRKHKIKFMRLIAKVIQSTLDYHICNYQLYLIDCNVEALEIDFYSTLSLLPILMLSRTNFKIIIHETNLLDGIALKLAKSIREQSILNIKFIFVSQTMLLANLSHVQLITAIMKNNPSLTSFQITDCSINNLDFKRFFVDKSKRWHTIDLSGCNMGDDGFETLCKCFSFNVATVHINELNVSQNCFTSYKVIPSIIKLLQCCITKKLIFSHHSSTNRRCIFNGADLDLLHSEKPILNFLHKIPLIVIESVYDKEDLCIVKSQSEIFPCSSLFLQLTLDDEEQLQCDGFVMKHENSKFSITLQQLANVDIVKSYDKHILHSVTSEVEHFLNYDNCLHILDLSENNNTDNHCSSIITMFINEKRLLKNVKELWITLEQFTLSFVRVFVKTVKFCHIEKLLVIGSDIQQNYGDIQAVRRLSKLKMLNCIVSVTLVIIKDINFEISKDNELKSWKIISNAYLKGYAITDDELKSIFQTLSMNKYSVSECHISNCVNQSDTKIIHTLFDTTTWIKFSLLEIYFSDKIAMDIIDLFNLSLDSGKISYVIKSNTMLVAYKSQENVIMSALETADDQLVTLHLLYCPLSKRGFYEVGTKFFKKSKFYRSIIITGTDIMNKINPFLCKLWLKNQSNYIQIFDISSDQLTMSCAQVIFKTMRLCIIEKLIICDSTRIMSNLIITEFNNGKQLYSLIVGIPVFIINIISNEHHEYNYVTTILSNSDVGNQVHFLKKISSEYKISVCSLYLLNNNMFLQNHDLLYYCRQLHDIQLHVYIIEPNLMSTSCTSLRVLKQLTEHPEMKISYFCATDTTLFGNKSNHWMICKALTNPTAVNLQITNCKTELFNNRFCTTLTTIQRQWQLLDFNNCNIGYHKCLKLMDCFLGNNSTIKSLTLSHNNLSEVSIILLAKLVLHCQINTLNISYNKLKDMQKFIETFVTVQWNTQTTNQPLNLRVITDDTTSVMIYNSSITILSIVDILTPLKHCNNFFLVSCQFNSSDSEFNTIMTTLHNIDQISSISFYNNNLQFWEIKEIIKMFQNISLHIEQQYFEHNDAVIDCNFAYSVVTYEHNKPLSLQYNKLIPSLPTICFTFIRGDKIHKCKLRSYSQLKSAVQIIEELQEDAELQMLEMANCNKDITLALGTLISRQNSTEYISFINVNSEFLIAVGENLKHIKSLKYFSVSFINISNNKAAAELILSMITNNPALEDVTISHCNCDDTIFRNVTKALQPAHLLKNLNLSGNLISDIAVKQLATVLLNENNTLQRLQLSQCKVDVNPLMQHNAIIDGDIITETQNSESSSSFGLSHVKLSNCDFIEAELITIFDALINKSSLKTIDISSNHITDVAALKLAEVIRNNVNIKCLNLLNCSFSQHGITAILASLRNVLSLQCIMLNFKVNKLPTSSEENSNSIEMLASVVSNHKLIAKIILNNCKSDKVINALSELSSLQLLDLSSSTLSSNVLASIVANNVNLQYLNISYCKIPHKYFVEVIDSTLLLRSLEYLNLSGHLITADIANTISDTITRNVKLRYFNISECVIETDGCIIIFKALQNIKCLSYLDVSYNSVGELAANELVKLLQSSKQLTHLSLSHCEINQQYFCQLTKFLKGLTYLRCLSINSIAINDVIIVDGIAAAISTNQMLQQLDLSECKLAGHHLAKILAALKQLSRLQYLNVSTNEVNDEASTELSSVINNSNLLEYLYFNDCNIQESGMKKISLALTNTKSLLSLEIGKCYITEKVAVDLANAIQCNPALINLCFSNCFTKASCVAIFESIQMTITSLTCLNLQNNPLSIVIVESLASALANNVKLEHLDISNCCLTERGLNALFNKLQNIARLQYLNLGSSNITKQAAIKIAAVLNNNVNLQYLNLSKCQLSPPALFVIASTLTNVINLRYFDISHNTVDEYTASEIASGIKSNVSLENLNLSNCNLNHAAICIIADALKSISSLLSLNLSYNFINKQAAVILTAAIHNNLELKELQFSGCFMQDASFVFLSAVKMKRKLRYIHFNSSIINYHVADLLVSSFANNRIVFIDLSDCHMKEFAFMRLLSGLKQTCSLHHLNIAKNRITERMVNKIASVLSNNSGLKYLNISSCNLPTLSFAKTAGNLNLSNLQYFDVSCNKISGKFAVFVASVLNYSKNTLEFLDLHDCELQESGISIIAHALANVQFIKLLNISNNVISEKAAKKISAAITHHVTLQHLNISNCFADDAVASLPILDALKSKKTLTYLNLKSNSITHEMANSLATVIVNNTQLKHIDLSNCSISESLFLIILNSLKNITSLQHLALAANNISSIIAKHLAVVVCNTINLSHLNLSNTNLEVTPLLNNLTLGKILFLNHLDLSCNVIDEQESKVLVRVLANSNEMKYINFSKCSISEVGISNVLSSLREMTSLQYISLESCGINDETSALIATIISNNFLLTYLNLTKCNLSHAGLAEIALVLKHASSLQHISLGSIDFTNEAAFDLSKAIKCNLPLKKLKLGDCNLEETGLLYITEALQTISSLQQLDLSGNIITDKAAASLALALSNNVGMEYLDLSYCTWEYCGQMKINEILHKLSILKQCDL